MQKNVSIPVILGQSTGIKKKINPLFNSLLCEGCGACQLICPNNAIKLIKINNGKNWFCKKQNIVLT